MHSKANMNDMVVIEITGLYKKLIIFCSMNDKRGYDTFNNNQDRI